MFLRVLAACLFPMQALACSLPVCIVDPETLTFSRLINFDDQPSAWDPGVQLDEILVLNGARFAERFAGQTRGVAGDFDAVAGDAAAPLTLLPGAPGENLAIVNLYRSNILNGYGPAGYPNVHAQGEGAIAVIFDRDQSAFALQILGGENGRAWVQFLARDGRTLHRTELITNGTLSIGFLRQGEAADIAGFVVTNQDPQGIAIDNLRFDPPPQLG